MPDSRTGCGWDQRFLASTRGQVAMLLRRGPRTVEELAVALGLTDNAVRAHLAALERDGMAHILGVRRLGGSGKPAYEYVLTAAAEHMFPRPYADMLGTLYDVLSECLPAETLAQVARETGRRMARRVEGDRDSRGDRESDGESVCHHGAECAVAALNAIGGLAELEVCDRHGTQTIRADVCPLAEVVACHPGACALTAAFVSGLANVPPGSVRAECSLDERPHCRFTLSEESIALGDVRN